MDQVPAQGLDNHLNMPDQYLVVDIPLKNPKYLFSSRYYLSYLLPFIDSLTTPMRYESIHKIQQPSEP